jgi:hypothetical protein
MGIGLSMSDFSGEKPSLRLIRSEDDGLFHVGPFSFSEVNYLGGHDTLYLSNSVPNEGGGSGEWTPEGHVIGFDREGKVTGITLMSVMGSIASGREVELTIPVPRKFGISAADIQAAIHEVTGEQA